MNLAIYSPSNNALTETVIRAHRDIPGMNVKFYFGGLNHMQLEGKGSLLDLSLTFRIRKKIVNKLAKYKFTPVQEALAESLLDEEI